jgi:hypothetical protein
MADENQTATPPSAPPAPEGAKAPTVCAVCNNPWVGVEQAPRENPKACATCGDVNP